MHVVRAMLKSWMPPDLADAPPEEVSRGQTALGFAVVVALAATPYALLYLALGMWIAGGSAAVAALMAFVVAWRFHHNGNLCFAAHGLALTVTVGLCGVTLQTGGIHSPVAPWFLLPPMIPAMVVGKQRGLPWVAFAALWLSALHAALADLGRPPHAVHDLTVLAPTFVVQPRQATVVLEATPQGFAARVFAGDTLVVTAALEPLPPTPPRAQAVPSFASGDDASPWYRRDLLFHGPTWQVLHRGRTAAASAEAELRPANGQPRLAEVVDAAHQLLCVWSEQQAGWLGLPTGARGWSVHGPLPAGPLHVSARPSQHGDEVLADLEVLAPDGRVVVSGAGVRLTRATGSRHG